MLGQRLQPRDRRATGEWVTFHCVDMTSTPPGPQSLRAVRDEAASRLAAAGVPDPEVDADLLIGHVLGLSRGGVQARIVVGGEIDAADASELAGSRRAPRPA